MSQGQPRTSVIRRVHQPQMNDKPQIIEELDYSFFKVLNTTDHDLDFDVICSDGRFKIHKWVLFRSTDFFDHISSVCDCLIFSELSVVYVKKGFEMVYTGRTKMTSWHRGFEIIEAFRQIGIKNIEMN